MSAVSIFEIKGAKKDKIFNFFKGNFSVMRGPVDFLCVFRDLCEAFIKYKIKFFFKA